MKKSEEENNHIRLDKWLFVARFFKTRALALKAIKQGKVLYDNQKPSPSREVHIGATLQISFGELEKIIRVIAIDNTRKNAQHAQTLYEETPQSIAKREQHASLAKERRMMTLSAPTPAKRPQGRARRIMRSLRRKDIP